MTHPPPLANIPCFGHDKLYPYSYAAIGFQSVIYLQDPRHLEMSKKIHIFAPVRLQCVLFHCLLAGAVLLIGCDGGRRQQMEALLDRADSMNRAYVPMTGGLDSLLLNATLYFDRHGTPNERMRAYYLLGCTYRDQQDAPAALQSYQNAIDCADTLSADCDYQRLMAVYGQMADLFDAQNLPSDEIEAMEKYGQLALQEKDTLKYIKNLELLAGPYYLKGDTLGMLRVLKHAHDLYLSLGFPREASSLYGPVIDYYISKGQLSEAKKLMEEFETQSGLFDADGNISPGREIYYYIQGTYYLKRNEFNLAERCFRKLPLIKRKDAYKGFLSVFRKKGELDSVAKYAYLYEIALDTLHNQLRTETIHQMSSMYNYHRYQLAMAKETEKAKRMRLTLYAILAAVALGAGLFCFFLRRRRSKEKAKTDKLLRDYGRGKIEFQKLSREYNILKEENIGLVKIYEETENLKQDNETLRTASSQTKEELASLKREIERHLNQKELEITELQEQLRQKEDALKRKDVSDQFMAFSSSDIVEKFREKGNMHLLKKAQASEDEWRLLIRKFRAEMPLASAVLASHAVLSTNEMRVCMLVLLDFQNDEIMRLMNISSQNLTNFKAKANRKLFNTESAASLQANIKSAFNLS